MNQIKLNNSVKEFSIRVSIVAATLFSWNAIYAQKTTDSSEVYNVNRWVTGSIAGVGLIVSQEMLKRLSDADEIPVNEILSLDNSQVNWFDRRAVEQSSYSSAGAAQEISDVLLTVGALLPATLFIDKKIRKQWLDVTLMYLETQAITANLYIWAGPMFRERYRPVTYYNEGQFEMNTLRLGRNRHSWFSGHTANTAAGTFYWAKVLHDYHPEWNGRWKIWTVAATIPAVVGYLRYKALKHFPTDVLMGFVMGGGSGILIPHLHKKKELKKLRMSIYYSEEDFGLTARWTLK